MHKMPMLVAGLLCYSLVACSDDPESKPDPLFDTQRQALEKAKQVEGVLEDGKLKLDRALEAQQQDDNP